MALTSEQRAEVNRKNARKSTGPKSAEGKARSAQNAVTHGLTARQVTVIPGEDASEHQAFLQAWLDGYRPSTPGRRALVERAAEVAWKLRRLAHHEEAHAAHRARHAADDFAQQQQARAERLGELLRYDPLGDHGRSFSNDLRRLERNRVLRERADPMIVSRELETFLHGVHWKLARWDELQVLLEQDGFWEFDAKFLAVRLMCFRPEDVMIEPGTRHVFLCCNALHPSGDRVIDDVNRAILGNEGRSSNHYQVHALETEKIEPAAALASLQEIVAAEIGRLRRIEDHLAPTHEADLAEAETRALFTADAASAPLQRYELALDRSLRQTVATLESQAEPAAPSAVPEPARPAEPALAAAPVASPAAKPCQHSARRNEASSVPVDSSLTRQTTSPSRPSPPGSVSLPPRIDVA
ncbi:MAG: hypothetical protein U0794_01950 [Isosphaeraceae bacterium]